MKNSEDYKQYHKARAKAIMAGLEKRNMKGYYFEHSEDAVTKICSMIQKGDLVGLGGSETIIQTGLLEELRKLDIRLLDRYKEGISQEVINEMRRKGLQADLFISGTNAITLKGELVNQDGLGNRIAGLVYGPKKVIIVAGMNKVVPTIEDAIHRIRDRAGPLNAKRVNVETPCYHTGICNKEVCFPPNSICGQLLIIESSMRPDRIHVFLIGENLGF